MLTGAVLAGVLTGVLGCGSDTAAPAPLASTRAYASLGLNQHAVMLALTPPYDTVQLTATPLNFLREPVTTPGTVTYRVLDTAVTVSATGLVTAHDTTAPGYPVGVVASLRDPAQGITHYDTVLIAVTATPLPAIATFSMQPAPGDSAKRALPLGVVGRTFPWPVRAADATGTPVCDAQQCPLLVRYRSSKPFVATIDPLTGTVTPQDTGHVVFTAQTLAYGRVLRDSVDFRIGYQLQTYILLTLAAILGVLTVGFIAPKKLILGVGALVMFCNRGLTPTNPPVLTKDARPIDVVFDHTDGIDSASCAIPGVIDYALQTGSGDIAPFGGDTLGSPADAACRRFTTPGVYHYHSALFPSDTYEIDIRQDPR